MSDYHEPADLSPARERRRSRYTRPRSFIIWWLVVIGASLGMGGALFFTWEVAPVEEFNTVPRQLRMDDRAQYVVAIMLNHSYENDLNATVERLIDLNLPGDDPIEQVAVIACDLVSTGYASSNSGLRAIRAMMNFYQPLGKSGCADELLPVNSTPIPEVVEATVPTPTLAPPASKTPTPAGTLPPSPTPPPLAAPTNANTRNFTYFVQGTFCDTELSGLIEVRVIDFDGQPLPGQPIRVRWDAGESLFFSGLKPERGADYADFEMEADTQYVIEMPGLSDPSPTPLTASNCFTEAGEQALTSYRIVFRAN